MDERHYLLVDDESDEAIVLTLIEGAHLLKRNLAFACPNCTPMAPPNEVVLHALWRETA